MDSRADDTAQRDEPPVLWPRYGTQRPVVILIDRGSFSAAEAVAYSLQSTGRATVVGEVSGGGAHMLGEAIVLDGRFRFYVPEQRPLSPRTDSNWEGHGVQPDICVTTDDALDAAVNYLVQVLDVEN